MRRFLIIVLSLVVVLGTAGWATVQFTPGPKIALYRWLFDRGGVEMAVAMEAHVPPGVRAVRDLQYLPDDPDAKLDVYYPERAATDTALLPVMVWVHGGAWISGNKEQVAPWCKILASKGYVVVCMDYTLAPKGKFPTPVREVNAVLGYVHAHAAEWGADTTRIILGGDSAGAGIAAQVAMVTTDTGYAGTLAIHPAARREALVGMVLFCGGFDLHTVNYDGGFGGFLRSVMWAYSGRKDFLADTLFARSSVPRHVTAAFPPTFLSAGNADPLLPQSTALAARLGELGVSVDTLFFPADHEPPLAHEYQFLLDIPAGQEALERATAFLARVSAPVTLASAAPSAPAR